MKRYIGTKIIAAKPMNRADYNTLRGWALPADENGADEGYLVEYLDGGKPNMDGFAGYVSWSPKAQFEGAYRERAAIEGLQPHEQRVVDEKADLDEKREKLSFFFNMPQFFALPESEQSRLLNQGVAMRTYSNILGARIRNFSGLEPESAGDTAIEQEIQAKGLTAPRVTLSDIEANIDEEHCFTADVGFDALRFQWLLSDHENPAERQAARELLDRMSVMSISAARADIDAAMGRDGHLWATSLSLLTFCVLVLRNGFTVTGESACACPENFDAELGRKIARTNAVNKIWPLMGYALKEQLHQAQQPAQAPD